MYTLLIKFAEDASEEVKTYYRNYKTHHDGDAGIDLMNTSDITVDSLDVGTIDFKIQCEMVRKETNKSASYYLYPRSSISKTAFMLANSVGIIDAGYRGNIMAKVRNMTTSTAQIKKGEKLFQICSPMLEPIEIKIVDSLTKTSRGDGGFGSTDKKFTGYMGWKNFEYK